MGAETAISWTDHTFNPWWGCERVSPGCQNCYAEAFAKRTGHPVWGKTADRRFFGDKHWAEPRRWNNLAEEAGKPALVFCSSMADVFEDRLELDSSRADLWSLIEATPWLIWQLLTKRPENVLDMVPAGWHGAWPRNVWVGTTAEDQARADERIPHLVRIPAPVRFLSVEPMLGPVDLGRCVHPASHVTDGPWHDDCAVCGARRRTGRVGTVDWVICGGESGPRHRPFDLDWARSLRDQCASGGVPFFFKQVGGLRPTSGGHLLDGETLHAFPPQRWAVPGRPSTLNQESPA